MVRIARRKGEALARAEHIGVAPSSGDGGAGSSLSPFDQLTLLALQDRLEGSRDAVARLLESLRSVEAVDIWEGQGLLPLIKARLERAALLNRLAQPVRERLVSVDAAYADIGQRYLIETQAIVHEFGAAGVQVLVDKDQRAFSPFYARPCYDLDLLIHRRDLDLVTELLRSRGYEASLATSREAFVDKVRGFDRYEGDLLYSIDLHWHVLGGYYPRAKGVVVESFFASATTEKVGGLLFPVMALEPHIVNCCLHTYQHETRFPSRLLTWLDISEAARWGAGQVDWEEVASLASRFGCENDVYFGLLVAERLLNAPIPSQVLRELRPHTLTVGLDAALYGYLTYVYKYLDDATALGLVETSHRGWQLASTLLPRAMAMRADVETFLAQLSSRGVDDVRIFGGPSGGFLPSASVRQTGRLEVVCPVGARHEAERALEASGFRWESSARLVRAARSSEGIDYKIEARVDPGLRMSADWLDEGYTIGKFFLALLLRRKRTADLEIVLRPLSVTDALCHMLSRYRRSGAVDLLGITAIREHVQRYETEIDWALVRTVARKLGILARSVGVLELNGEFPKSWGRDGDAVGSGPLASDDEVRDEWNMLESLDRRTRHLEALSKLLVTKEGLRLAATLDADSMADFRRAVRAWYGVRGSRGILQDVRRVWVAGHGWEEGRRVPPRIYLSRAGHYLTDLRPGPQAS
jgi:hypothetical protein